MSNTFNNIGKCPFCNSPVRILELKSEVIYESTNSRARFVCTGCNTEFLVSDRRKGLLQSTTKDMIKKFNTRKPIEDMVEQIHNAGGCDGNTDYDKGWDDAMAAAEKIVRGGAE